MSEICPKCGTVNRSGRSTCAACGAELEVALFAEMFGPPRLIKNRFAIQHSLKQGRQISLFRALDTKGNRPCLVHQISLTTLDLDMREIVEHRFLQEAAAWQQRQHPNILRILDADVQNHRLYLITEPITGKPLAAIIRDRANPVSEQDLVHWASQICDALAYLHTQDPPVVLGSMSPATIYVDQTGTVRLAEVGLIRYQRSGLIGSAKGIPGYAAPEQRQGIVTPRSDLYTLGIILYELITRLDPKQRPLPSLSKYAAGLSEPLLEAVSRAYRKEPEKRFPSAADMRQALAGASLTLTPDLPPFALAEGLVCHSVPELLHLCAQHWDDGLLALINGRIAQWLAQAAQQLRETDHETEADEIERTAQYAAQSAEQIANDAARPGLTGVGREVARNAAYAAWLQEMGALGMQPSAKVSPNQFDFGMLTPSLRATSTLHIQNKGQGYLTGRVESLLPWITIPNPVFGCHANETAEVRVVARGRALRGAISTSPEAIHVVTNGGNAWIGAQAESSPPILRVTPQVLDFGPITRSAARVAHITVANDGGGRLAGRAIPRAPWLRVRHPDFSCSAGASAQLAVELLSEQLPQGAVRIRRALAIDSDSGQAQVDVAWKWAKPGLELDTVGLDFGSVRRGEQIVRTLTLSNSGTADLVGEVHSSFDWLQVQPSGFRCSPGTSQILSATCDTRLLSGGSTVEPEAIEIVANAGAQTLSASVEIMAARLIVEPQEIDLGTVSDDDQVEETFTVGNRGSMPWKGRIYVHVPWLTVEPTEVECEPGHFMPVTVLLDTQALESGGAWAVENAIQVGEGPEAHHVAVHLELARPQLAIARHSLDFGLIGRTDIAGAPFEIANSGTGDLNWRISMQGTWLEAVPSSGTCRAGETSTIQVNAYALALEGETGQAWLTIHSNGGRIDLPASVALSSPLLVVEPLEIELESENYEPASQTIRISNRGVGTLRGQVIPQVPWLACDPQTFECNTGISTQIRVQANMADLKEGTLEEADALLVESNSGQQSVSARVTLTWTPRLYLAQQELLFAQDSERSIQIENQGYAALHIRVVPGQPWIAVNRQEWTIKPQKKIRLQVKLLDAPQDAAGSIDIQADDETVRLPVRHTA
jgi:hypothetical protein